MAGSMWVFHPPHFPAWSFVAKRLLLFVAGHANAVVGARVWKSCQILIMTRIVLFHLSMCHQVLWFFGGESSSWMCLGVLQVRQSLGPSTDIEAGTKALLAQEGVAEEDFSLEVRHSLSYCCSTFKYHAV